MAGLLLPGWCTVLAVLLLRAILGRHFPKRILVLLWVGALLILLAPGLISSPFSVYGLIPQQEGAAGVLLSVPFPTAEPVHRIWKLLRWSVTGLACLGLAGAYLLGLLRLKRAQPVTDPAVTAWLAAHPLLRPLQVRSGAVASPLCCGVLLPSIILPADTDFTDRDRLDCVLSHEYVHICRFDPLLKLFFSLVLCLRWYDPFVWIAFFMAGRDMEYACDEAVLDSGIDSKRYASVLLRAVLGRAKQLPCSAHFNNGQTERRVRLISSHKPPSLSRWLAAGALALALLLCLGTVPKAGYSNTPGSTRSLLLSSVHPGTCKPDKWTWSAGLPVLPKDPSEPKLNAAFPIVLSDQNSPLLEKQAPASLDEILQSICERYLRAEDSAMISDGGGINPVGESELPKGS